MRWFEAWKASLPDGTVCGREDILFDPEFETLQNEVNKNDALQADSRTDWGLVLEMATSLLSRIFGFFAMVVVRSMNRTSSRGCPRHSK